MPKSTSPYSVSPEEALEFHRKGKPGKLEICPTKLLTSARELSLAYSPGVAVPCLKIEQDSAAAYEYTSKGNMVFRENKSYKEKERRNKIKKNLTGKTLIIKK